MKVLVFVLAALALAQSVQIKPAHINPPTGKRLALTRPNPRITGGVEATPHSIPWQVGLLIETDDGTAFCGGSLLSPTTVVTAAHCGELNTRIEVRLGAHRILDNEPTQVRVNTTSVLVHPRWDRLTLENDISILRIPAVTLNDDIQPIKLPTNLNNNYLNNVATASGWGLDSDNAETISPVLREVQVPVGENGICNLYYFGVIIDSHLCTSGDQGKSTCSGDSGGPLVASTGELIGITSFGLSLGCEIGWPSVFTRVTSFVDWVKENSDVV